MQELMQEFEDKEPEIVFEWQDSHTSAKGWIVINSLRGRAAAGGTRMRVGVTKNEVLSLAKTMEITTFDTDVSINLMFFCLKNQSCL